MGALAGVLNCSYGSALLARAQSHLITLLMAIQVTVLIGGSLLAFHFGGERAYVIAVACVEWFIFPFHVLVMIRQRLWQPEVDLPIAALAIAAFVWVLW